MDRRIVPRFAAQDPVFRSPRAGRNLAAFFATLFMIMGAESGAASTVDDAIAVIRNAHTSHPDLPTLIESDAALRAQYTGAHLALSQAAYDPMTSNADKAKIRGFHLRTCFFRDAPQEFFASIANIWFVDSAKTIDLALARFEQGRRSPLDQALFFVDVYSMGTNKSRFYSSNANADVARTDVDLERDSAGRITSIRLGGKQWRFVRSSAGEVISYDVVSPRRRVVRK